MWLYVNTPGGSHLVWITVSDVKVTSMADNRFCLDVLYTLYWCISRHLIAVYLGVMLFWWRNHFWSFLPFFRPFKVPFFFSYLKVQTMWHSLQLSYDLVEFLIVLLSLVLPLCSKMDDQLTFPMKKTCSPIHLLSECCLCDLLTFVLFHQHKTNISLQI